jgi:PAS domain S-box-containing protein
MDYALKELLDILTVQTLLNSLDEISRLPSAVIDMEGNILTASAWQDICTKFHRVNHNTEKKCNESDTHIQIKFGESLSPIVYQCPMGMTDCAFPIIVEGKHIGNVFIGQLFLEQPDEAFFTEQARKYGFDENAYLEAVHKVPLCSEEQIHINLKFISNLVQLLAEQGLQSKRQLESERDLRESEKKLQVIFDSSEAGIIVVSPIGIITFANKRMASMFGMSLNELVGTSYFDYVHESEKQTGVECMEQVILGKIKSVEFDRHYIRKDGTDLWGHLTGTRFENVDGSIRDQIIVISDITESKRAEEEKRLLELQLQHAQKLESLGVLAGGIAHDFNNILTVITGSCFLMQMDGADAKKNILTIEKATERAAALCRQMLAYAGKAPIVHTQVNMGEVLDDMIDLLKTTIPKTTEINFDKASTIPFIKGDSSQLSQIVLNIVINASEAIGDVQGEIRISLSTTEIKAEQIVIDYLGNTIPVGSYVRLEISDNGSGMDDEIKRRIFEPFYTTKFTGRGLGMSAILGIIKGHQGALQLESQLGQGTTFKVFLPAQSDKSISNRSSLPTPHTAWQGSGTILLVEDEEQILLVAKLMLEKLGHTVIEASNGREALDMFQKHIDDIVLVVTDIGMPIMDGYQLFSELKKLNPNLPIIIASGFGNTVVTSHIPRKDIAALINKPYDFDRIRDVMKNVMDDVMFAVR